MRRTFYQKTVSFLLAGLLFLPLGSTFGNPLSLFSNMAPKTELKPTNFTPPLIQPELVKDALKVVFVSPEVDPFSKAGGMADVLLGLPRAVREEGHESIVISPMYTKTKGDEKRDKPFKQQLMEQYDIPFDSSFMPTDPIARLKIWVGDKEFIIPVTKIQTPDGVTHFHFHGFEKLYTVTDTLDWFLQAVLLSRATLELFKVLEISPDIINSNDWMSALVPTLLKTDPAYTNAPVFQKTKTIHTIHNSGGGYQGSFPYRFNDIDLFQLLNLHGDHFYGLRYFNRKFWKKFPHLKGNMELLEDSKLPPEIRDNPDYWSLNLTAAAVGLHADQVLTVSEGFAKETLSFEYTEGLDLLLKKREKVDQFRGIVNGTDLAKWIRDLDTLGGKENAKKDLVKRLQEQSGLRDDSDGPILGMVTRITRQKGVGLVVEKMASVLRRNENLRFVFLGSAQDNDLQGKGWEKEIKELEDLFPGRVSVTIAFDRKLADQIILGSDLFLMPSMYEPCGIAQLDAMASKTIPIVRATGGLDDTVEDFNAFLGVGSGIKFKDLDGDQMVTAIERGIKLYEDKILWWQLMANARDRAIQYTWKNSARKYLRLFLQMLGKSTNLPGDEMAPPSPFLYENPRDPHLELDSWDKKNYTWDSRTGYWRSKNFPNLVLGSWRDLELETFSQKLSRHVAIRMRSGWTLYIVDEHKWAAAYIKEAQLRGEIPLTGNDQIFLDKHPSHQLPEEWPGEKWDLRQYNEYVSSLEKEGSLNSVLAQDGTVWRHFWINSHDRIKHFSPLAGRAHFYGSNSEDFFEIPFRPLKSAIINMDINSGLSPGQILGILNRMSVDGIVPLGVFLSAEPAKMPLDWQEQGDKSFDQYIHALTERIPRVFSEENSIRSLEARASFRHWTLIFDRLFKRYSGDVEKIQINYRDSDSATIQQTLAIPRVLFERRNLFLAARFLAVKVINVLITEGGEEVLIENQNKRLEVLFKEELRKYAPALSDLSNFGRDVQFQFVKVAVGPERKEKAKKSNLHLYTPESDDHIYIGIHLNVSKIKIVLFKNQYRIHVQEIDLNPGELSGQAVREKIVSLIKDLLSHPPAEVQGTLGAEFDIDAIGVSVPGPVSGNQILRLLNFERVWRLEAKTTNFSRQFDKEYEELNQLESRLKSEFQKEGLQEVVLLNDADAYGFAEIYERNGDLTGVTKIALTIGTGIGYAKIKEGRLDNRPNEGGHLIVRLANRNVVCQACGAPGCLEEYVSERGILRRAKLLGFTLPDKNFTAENVAESAVYANNNLKRMQVQLDANPESEFNKDYPMELQRYLSENQIIAFLIFSSIADIYADAFAQLKYQIDDVSQFILAGRLMQGESGELLKELILKSLASKYPYLIAEQEEILVIGKANVTLGGAIGAARYALSAYLSSLSPLPDESRVLTPLDTAI